MSAIARSPYAPNGSHGYDACFFAYAQSGSIHAIPQNVGITSSPGKKNSPTARPKEPHAYPLSRSDSYARSPGRRHPVMSRAASMRRAPHRKNRRTPVFGTPIHASGGIQYQTSQTGLVTWKALRTNVPRSTLVPEGGVPPRPMGRPRISVPGASLVPQARNRVGGDDDQVLVTGLKVLREGHLSGCMGRWRRSPRAWGSLGVRTAA